MVLMRRYRKPYRIKKKKSIFKNRFFWLAILILIICGGNFYLICFSSFFQIREIKISGNQKVPTTELKDLIESQLTRPLLFLSSKSIFLVNLNQINNAILEKFPQIFKADFERKFPNLLVVEIKERTPVAIFLKEEKQFLLDQEGIIFEEIFQANSELVKIKNQNIPNQLRLGEKVISKEKLSSILGIQSKLKGDFKIITTEILVVSDERINVETSEGWKIYINPKKNIEWQLTKLKVVLEKEIPFEKRRDLEYIELRFGNLAPYKYR